MLPVTQRAGHFRTNMLEQSWSDTCWTFLIKFFIYYVFVFIFLICLYAVDSTEQKHMEGQTGRERGAALWGMKTGLCYRFRSPEVSIGRQTVAVHGRARACKSSTAMFGCDHRWCLLHFRGCSLQSVDAGSGLWIRLLGWVPPRFGMRSALRCRRWLGLLQCKQACPSLQRRCLCAKTHRHGLSSGWLLGLARFHHEPSAVFQCATISIPQRRSWDDLLFLTELDISSEPMFILSFD